MLSIFSVPTIFAHRGASAYAPENTMAAFELAAIQGAQAVEFDVKLTTDKQVVIHHDQTLERTTNGTGHITKRSYAELKELDAGSWKSEKYRGEKIPLLSDVLEAVGKKVLINIELTNYATPMDGLVSFTAAIVKKHNLQKRIMFSSFYFTNLVTARRLLPDVPIGLLILDGRQGWHQRMVSRLIRFDADHPYLTDVNENMVTRLHKQNRRVNVWTVNDPKDMRDLRSMGVDGIFTDDPILALENFK